MAEFNADKWAQKRDDVLVSQWFSTPSPFTSTFSYNLQAIAVLPTNPEYKGPVHANLVSSNLELPGTPLIKPLTSWTPSLLAVLKRTGFDSLGWKILVNI